MERIYITNAIDFSNAAPHIGHALEKVLSDVLARYFRLKGHDVRLLVGTDDHGINIQNKAKAAGMEPKDFVEQHIPVFKKTWENLNISFDYFVSTSKHPDHYDTAKNVWSSIMDSGHLTKETYTGLYCPNCEKFMAEKDLENGLCPYHLRAPEEVSEENWFFDLAMLQPEIKKILTERYHIKPDYRSNEIHTMLEEPLPKVSFSRETKNLHWGVPVPNDAEQVM